MHWGRVWSIDMPQRTARTTIKKGEVDSTNYPQLIPTDNSRHPANQHPFRGGSLPLPKSPRLVFLATSFRRRGATRYFILFLDEKIGLNTKWPMDLGLGHKAASPHCSLWNMSKTTARAP